MVFSINLAKVFVGNKHDLESRFEVSGDDIEALASQHGSKCILTSALNDTGVDETFEAIIESIETSKMRPRGATLQERASFKPNKKQKEDCKC